MEKNLEYNLYSKHALKFRTDGKLKILMISDIQETLNYDPRSLNAIDRLIEYTAPDLVVLGGDNCDGTVIKTEEEMKAYLEIFSRPMESRHIPWMHVFGNHDHDIAFDDLRKTKIYEQYDWCISKHTENLYGTTNFVLPVRRSDSDKVAFALWALDSNNDFLDSGLVPDKNWPGLNKPFLSGKWDIIHFEQLQWYWNTSRQLEDYAGKLVPGMLFMHIPLWEFQYVVDNPELTGAVGRTDEEMNLAMFNSGLFSLLLQRQDIHTVACGHSHEDCFQGEYCGIRMCMDACAGYSPYGIDSIRGGRVFELDERDLSTVHTYMVHYQDIL